MRTGAHTIHQTLTPEAASVLKHSLALARRRGHSQVTPLHVASTLLTSSRSNIFRRACLKSQPFNGISLPNSHPSLHCRALELCFNVALNRLPTNPNPLFQPQPSLSNALIAALKRAQAHQRRGSIEQQNQQQQPFLAVKVELEQLVVSILDDPSVSRVMREAGFSSTVVKNNIEDDSSVVSPVFYGSSVGVFSSPCSPSSSERDQNIFSPGEFWQTYLFNHSHDQNPVFNFPQKRIFRTYSNFSVKEDVELVIETLVKKKKNTVIVGDNLSLTEGIVAELMGKIERGEVPDDLKQTHFIRFQISLVGLKLMRRDDVETHVNQLKRKVDCFTSCGKGVIVCLGELNWTVSDNSSSSSSSSSYSAVNHLVEEIGSLVCKYSKTSGTKVWVLGTASYQTYKSCQMRQPPLDVQWALQSVSVPSGGLELTLHASSTHESRIKLPQRPSQDLDVKQFSGKEEEDKLSSCGECTFNYEKEAQAFKSSRQKMLPPWLQPHGENADQKDELVGLRRKWNRFCQSLHRGKTSAQSLFEKGYAHPSSSFTWCPGQSSNFPDSSASISFADSSLRQNHHISCSVAKFRRQNSCNIEFSFGNGSPGDQIDNPMLDACKECEGKETKISLALGRSPFTSDSERSDEETCERKMNMRDLSKKLHENLPWQSEILPSIESVLADSIPRRNEIWIMVLGNDLAAKRRLARGIAESLFGSVDFLLDIKMRKRGNQANGMLTSALKDRENLVVLVEGIDSAGSQFIKFLSDGFETRKFGESDRRELKNGQVIFILTRDDCPSDEDELKCQDFIIQMSLKVNMSHTVNSPNADHKRKAGSEISSQMKSPRTNENGNASLVACEASNIKKEFSRQPSFNSTLDLNLKADEEDEEGAKPENITPILNGFLGLIENRFDLSQNQAQKREMREVFLRKMKNSYEEILGGEEKVGFSVEKRVIEELCLGCGFFLNSLFEKWVKEVFERGLKRVKKGGKEGTGVIRVCFGGIGDKVYEEEEEEEEGEEGFMGTCLPKKVQVSFVE